MFIRSTEPSDNIKLWSAKPAYLLEDNILFVFFQDFSDVFIVGERLYFYVFHWNILRPAVQRKQHYKDAKSNRRLLSCMVLVLANVRYMMPYSYHSSFYNQALSSHFSIAKHHNPILAFRQIFNVDCEWLIL